MSLFLFYPYINGSLHVSGLQAHPQENSHSCSHNYWFLYIYRTEHDDTEHGGTAKSHNIIINKGRNLQFIAFYNLITELTSVVIHGYFYCNASNQ
jgi:hypothetical protein